MEVFIAMLILIGVLSVSGGAPDKAPASAPERLAAARVIERPEVNVHVSCDGAGPHHRDLTLPHASRPAGAVAACDGRESRRDE